MKRRDVIRRLHQAAHDADVEVTIVRDTGPHTIYAVGGQRVSIPRHREVQQGTAEAIFRQVENVLGKGWWR